MATMAVRRGQKKPELNVESEVTKMFTCCAPSRDGGGDEGEEPGEGLFIDTN